MDHKKKKKLKDGWHRVVLSEDIDKHERSKELQFYTKQRWRRRRRDVAFQLMRKIFTTVHMSAIRRYIRDDAFIIRVNGASPRRRKVYYITDVTFYGSYR